MPPSVSSLFDFATSAHQLNSLIWSGRLTAYENEVPVVLWQDELGRLRIWIAETDLSSLEVQSPYTIHTREQLYLIQRRLQRTLTDMRDAFKCTADGAMSDTDTDADDDDVDRTEMQMIYHSLRDTIHCLNQIAMVTLHPVHQPLVSGKVVGLPGDALVEEASPDESVSFERSAGLASAAVAGLVERAGSQSRPRKWSRSHSWLGQALPVVAAGLGTAAVTGLYEKNKEKKEEEAKRRGRSRSRSRALSDIYPDPARDSAGLIEYGDAKTHSATQLEPRRPRPRILDEDASPIERGVHAPYLRGRREDDADAVLLCYGGISRRSYSIEHGVLDIELLRHHAMQITQAASPDCIKLFYNGKVLEGDSLSCRDEGLQSGSTIYCEVIDADETQVGKHKTQTGPLDKGKNKDS